MKSNIVTIYNSIQAGFNTPADEESRYTMDIASYVIERPNTSVLVTVKWESMIDAGIYPWDIVVVDKWARLKKHDIVIAKIDSQYTLKYYEKDNKWDVFLSPANSSMSDIYPTEELEIFWVVKSLIRKY